MNIPDPTSAIAAPVSQSIVTIVVVPRERFSHTLATIDSIYLHTRPPLEVVVVDGGFPAKLRVQLDIQAKAKGFRIVGTKHYVSPNQARNLGFGDVTTKYVVFIDNDVLVTPGWLDRLTECAEETGADLVGPLYLIGRPEQEIIHMAGGMARIFEKNGERHLREEHFLRGKRMSAVRADLHRGPTELIEFHCMLARKDVVDRLGPLDENVLSSPEHIDFCLIVRQAGGGVYFEPASVVTYVPPPPLTVADLHYYLLRWSDAWNRSSLSYFGLKWHLAKDDAFLATHYRWLTGHRHLALLRWRRLLRRVVGYRIGCWTERVLERAITPGSKVGPVALPPVRAGAASE